MATHAAALHAAGVRIESGAHPGACVSVRSCPFVHLRMRWWRFGWCSSVRLMELAAKALPRFTTRNVC